MKVVLVEFTPDPDKLCASAARVCYSPNGFIKNEQSNDAALLKAHQYINWAMNSRVNSKERRRV